MINFKWSEAEKKVARRAFDAALKRECAAVMEKLKGLAAKAERPDDIWAIHDYLTAQRKTVDGKYDYRYSQLIFVFVRLLRENWIEDKDLDGLGEEKLQSISYIASF
ncbi:MAG: hypothetical protein NT047_05865 [Deltaproteobacteria bacterium]|nr:hypothetical protein [Deltaproteobacteria bacterium]